MKKIKRIVLEMSLKPFKKRNEKYIYDKCEKILKSWESLINSGEEISILLWVGDGSEILLWDGDLNKEINWAKYIGYCNYDFGCYPEGKYHRVNKAQLYMKNPPRLRYKELKIIISSFKKICKEKYKKKVRVGIPFDSYPEFVHDKFRYVEHPEILSGGPHTEYKTLPVVCCWKEIENVNIKVKGFSEGIKGKLPFGEFLGKQFSIFSKDFGVDYIWFSNGFGFTPYSWYHKGEIFDGEKYRIEKVKEIEKRVISFWRIFRREYKGPIEVRGTDSSVGIDIAKDAINYKKIYEVGKLKFSLPNTPWGSKDLGGEIGIYLTRLSEIPDGRIPIRFYINDPWFVANPWWDYYGGEPFDIYVPMTVSRINEKGEIEKFTDIELLTIDTEKGQVSEKQAEEVSYHIKRGIEFSPDKPGPILWVYPFNEYHSILRKPDLLNHIYFQDSFILRGISNGFPLN
ncbi:hypothetical protein J7L87_00085, partial [bacterium]|nr:hypothetical protein [bacterium]